MTTRYRLIWWAALAALVAILAATGVLLALAVGLPAWVGIGVVSVVPILAWKAKR